MDISDYNKLTIGDLKITAEEIKEVEKLITFESVCKQIKLTCIEYRKEYGECPVFCPMRKDEDFTTDKVDPASRLESLLFDNNLGIRSNRVYVCKARWPYAWNLLEVDDKNG